MEARRSTLSPGERDRYLLLVDYERAICSQPELAGADGASELLRLGGEATRELEAFIEEAERRMESDPVVEESVADARERVDDIRSRLLRLGRN